MQYIHSVPCILQLRVLHSKNGVLVHGVIEEYCKNKWSATY